MFKNLINGERLERRPQGLELRAARAGPRHSCEFYTTVKTAYTLA